MGDLWNPFDNNNPVYAKLARELDMQRYRVKTGALLIATVLVLAAYNQRSNLPFLGGRVNQFGVVSRK
tara:strand:+ start:458 stop:661 length:204 start_codon:yes stop_codon:yes gene_type:complete